MSPTDLQDSLFAERGPDSTAGRRPERRKWSVRDGRSAYFRWQLRVIFLIIGLALLFELLSSVFYSGFLASLGRGCWYLVLPLLTLLAARSSFKRLALACLLAYGGRTVLQVGTAVYGARMSGGSLGLGSVLYMVLSGMVLPLLILLFLGIGLQLLRLVRLHPAALYASAAALASLTLIVYQFVQLGITASLYGSGGIDLTGGLSYLLHGVGSELLWSLILFTLFYWGDFIIRSGRWSAWLRKYG